MRITNAIADLQQQIHDDLRRQHPEWVLPNGESPMCDAYEARLMDLLALESGSPQTTPERQRIGDEINATMIFARADFINVRSLQRHTRTRLSCVDQSSTLNSCHRLRGS
jgi:hypothetical protein